MNDEHLNWQVTPLNYQHALQLTPGKQDKQVNVLRLRANIKALLVMTKRLCGLGEKWGLALSAAVVCQCHLRAARKGS